MSPHVVSVNVGMPVDAPWVGSPFRTSISKHRVAGRVQVGTLGIEGDQVSDTKDHGGPHQAVYAFAREDLDLWAGRLGKEIPDGHFGENLTTEGIDVSGALVGERWRIGTTLLEVVQPRLPCFKLGLRIGDPTFLKRFALASRPGAYLRILEEGELGAGDLIEVDPAGLPDHGVSMRMKDAPNQ